VKRQDLEKLVLKRALTWARSEPVLRSLTNGNLERRPAAEIRLARAACDLLRRVSTRAAQEEK
jgi:hypothetical protein